MESINSAFEGLCRLLFAFLAFAKKKKKKERKKWWSVLFRQGCYSDLSTCSVLRQRLPGGISCPRWHRHMIRFQSVCKLNQLSHCAACLQGYNPESRQEMSLPQAQSWRASAVGDTVLTTAKTLQLTERKMWQTWKCVAQTWQRSGITPPTVLLGRALNIILTKRPRHITLIKLYQISFSTKDGRSSHRTSNLEVLQKAHGTPHLRCFER